MGPLRARLNKGFMNKDRKPPAPASDREITRSSESEINRFLSNVRRRPRASGAGRGRLIFAMDATMSRQPTWDRALAIQGDMFRATSAIGGLDVQLIYFRGLGECRASKWVGNPEALARLMTSVYCRGGRTQIHRVLRHALKETGRKPVSALVYVGDCMEENVDELCVLAGELGMLKVPVFMFHEGHEPVAGAAFREIARLSSGAYCRFDAASADQLRELLAAVAVYAAGGLEALADHRDTGGARRLIEQLR
jgi:hypothetical protein